MKNTIFLSAMLLCLISCTGAEEEFSTLRTKEFTCLLENSDSPATRTALGPGNAILWDNNDYIKVYSANNTAGTVFTDITLENQGRKATFKGMTESADSYFAVYPASSGSGFDPQNNTISVRIPTQQKATAGSFADNANTSVAKTAEDDLYFKNIGAVLAIKCPTAYASSLILRSSDKGIAMSGESEIDYSDGEPTVEEITDGVNYINLTDLGSSSYGKTYYLTAYPGDYKGFDIIITNTAKTHRSVISSGKVLKLERNDNILLYDGSFAGWNAPTEPYSVNASLEADFTLTVSWNCDSDKSLCKGFRIYARKSADIQTQTMVGQTNADVMSLNIRDLEENQTYDIGVQSIGSQSRYDSDIIWKKNVRIPDSGMYEWEKSREGILDFADLDLLAGGLTSKTPDTWNETRLKPHVTFIDENGKEQWLHEAFLFFGSEDSRSNSTFVISADGQKSGDQEAWKRFADYWISPEGVIKTLDKTISDAMSRIGQPGFKHKVIITMPDPIMLEYFTDKKSSTTYWGKVDGRQLDFKKTADQVLAYQWYIDYIRAAWYKAGPQNIELAGFYILSEELVSEESGWNYNYKRWDKILPYVSEYLHARKYGMYWIPYYQAAGYNKTSKLGIDYTWLQPNKYWDYPEKKQKKSWTWVFNTMNTYGHGMEIEFEGSHGESGWSQYEEGVARTSSSILETVRTNNDAQGTPKGQPNPQAARNKQLLRDYMTQFKENGYYGKARIATYSGTDAMYELAASPDRKDKEMYLEYCRFIVENPKRKQ
ncbi:MAG: DUF4855 domain-containing protein [Bacteroidales bacterium]|nr:DUF4855 domain-containing protein [Bacteroidales bacterium]